MTEPTSESRLQAIEERLRALEDDREILELLAVYGFTRTPCMTRSI